MKIICFHPGAIGDIVNTLPALDALRRQMPQARLTCLGQLEAMQLLAETGIIDTPLSLEYPGLHTLFHPELEPPESLVAFLQSFDLAVSWMRGAMNVFPERLRKLGLTTVFHPGPFPPPAGSGPAVRYYSEPLRQLGIELEAEHPRLPLSPEQRHTWLSAHPDLLDSPYLVLHPGSGSPRKNWPAERFAQLAKTLAARLNQRVVVPKGPADEEAVANMEKAAEGFLLVVKEGLSLRELAAILAGAALVVGNDSGVSHLAGAVGAPTVAIFRATDPAIWGVNQPHARNLGPGLVNLEDVQEAISGLILI